MRRGAVEKLHFGIRKRLVVSMHTRIWDPSSSSVQGRHSDVRRRKTLDPLTQGEMASCTVWSPQSKIGWLGDAYKQKKIPKRRKKAAMNVLPPEHSENLPSGRSYLLAEVRTSLLH
jgi:hypothetical protein